MTIRRSSKLFAIAAAAIAIAGCGTASAGSEKSSYDGLLHIEDGMAQPMVKYSDIKTDN
ncbi:MAG: hypothetical protein IKG37_11550 [Solobacterium sp.]|nr:hypothetical protein [Solobacterium sp.]